MFMRRISIAACLFAVACGKKVPSDIQPTLDAIRPDARRAADAAAKACAAQFTSSRFTVTGKTCATNTLPGETLVPIIPSPAKGTALETNPLVLEVETMCSAPVAPGEWCGSSLGALHNAFPRQGSGRVRNVVEGNCKATSTDCEEVVVPSQRAADETSADLRIVKPVSGGPAGATVELTVVLAKK